VTSSANAAVITLGVAHDPSAIPPDQTTRARTAFIVVDVIRATTTLAVMFERGVRQVYVARNVDAARAAHAALPGALLAGEIAAVAPPDFDCGNSPEEWGHLDVAGRDVLFSTTNGARALHAARGGGPIFAGSLRNATAVSAATLNAASALDDHARLLVVCSGRGDLPAIDDSLCAAWLLITLRAVAAEAGTLVALDEAARASVAPLDELGASKWPRAEATAWLDERLTASPPARDVLDVGLGADIAWCAALDASTEVPIVTAYNAELDLLSVERLT
jgi:2-phosphosulfolactate phosphatase